MELKENDFDSKIAYLDLNDFNLCGSINGLSLIDKTSGETISPKRPVRIFKEFSGNTEWDVTEATTQTDNVKSEKNTDVTQKFLFLRGQTKEVQDLIDVLGEKHKTIEEKCTTAHRQLSLINALYHDQFAKIRCQKVDAEVNTCESWLAHWNSMVNNSRQLVGVVDALRLAQDQIKDQSAQLTSLHAANDSQQAEIATLRAANATLESEKDAALTELTETRDTNEFLNAEHSSLATQIDRMQEDWTATTRLHETRVRKLRNEYRETNTRLVLERQNLTYQLQDEQLLNSRDKAMVGYLEERLAKFAKDVEGYPELGDDAVRAAVALQKRVTVLEDWRMGHDTDRECWRREKDALSEELAKGNALLNGQVTVLQGALGEAELCNRDLRTRLDALLGCFERLRALSCQQENRDPEKYTAALRAVIEGFDEEEEEDR